MRNGGLVHGRLTTAHRKYPTDQAGAFCYKNSAVVCRLWTVVLSLSTVVF